MKKIKRNDEVVVIAGSFRGKRGKVLGFFPKKNRLYIEGIALRKRFLKKSQQNPEGGVAEKEDSIHYSNVMLAAHYDARRNSKKEGIV